MFVWLLITFSVTVREANGFWKYEKLTKWVCRLGQCLPEQEHRGGQGMKLVAVCSCSLIHADCLHAGYWKTSIILKDCLQVSCKTTVFLLLPFAAHLCCCWKFIWLSLFGGVFCRISNSSLARRACTPHHNVFCIPDNGRGKGVWWRSGSGLARPLAQRLLRTPARDRFGTLPYAPAADMSSISKWSEWDASLRDAIVATTVVGVIKNVPIFPSSDFWVAFFKDAGIPASTAKR